MRGLSARVSHVPNFSEVTVNRYKDEHIAPDIEERTGKSYPFPQISNK